MDRGPHRISVARITARFLAFLALAALTLPGAATAGVADPLRPQQWNLDQIGADRLGTGPVGEGTTIAVVDTGASLNHEDLAPTIAPDADVTCLDTGGDPAQCSGPGADDHGHGTHVAGVAAAATGNGRGVASVAPGARLMIVRSLRADSAGGSASGSLADVDAGIRWAVGQGADVVNLSLGENVVLRGVLGSGLADAVRHAWSRGVAVVAAAGNTDLLFGSGYGDLPVVVVTATGPDGEKPGYATGVGNARWGLAAPGGDGESDEGGVVSTWWDREKGNGYAWAHGTSMAAPHVSGGLAVLLSRGYRPQQAVERLLETAVDLGPPGRDSTTGSGRLDLSAAVGGGATGAPAEEAGAGGRPGPAAQTPPEAADTGGEADSPAVRATEGQAPPAGDVAVRPPRGRAGDRVFPGVPDDVGPPGDEGRSASTDALEPGAPASSRSPWSGTGWGWWALVAGAVVALTGARAVARRRARSGGLR